MEKEEKELLLKDLCSRIPYRVKVAVVDFDGSIHKRPVTLLRGGWYDEYDDGGYMFVTSYYGIAHKAEEIRPYLRPISSMTEEEKLELLTLYLETRLKRFRKDPRIKETELFLDSCWYVRFTYKDENDEDVISTVYIGKGSYAEEIDWLEKNHFDYRGLIPMGLALEATKDMYV